MDETQSNAKLTSLFGSLMDAIVMRGATGSLGGLPGRSSLERTMQRLRTSSTTSSRFSPTSPRVSDSMAGKTSFDSLTFGIGAGRRNSLDCAAAGRGSDDHTHRPPRRRSTGLRVSTTTRNLAAVLEGKEHVDDPPKGSGSRSERPYNPGHWGASTFDSDHVIALMSNPQIQIQIRQQLQSQPPIGKLGSSRGGTAAASTAVAIQTTAAARPAGPSAASQLPPPLPTFLMESDGWEVTRTAQRRPSAALEKLGRRQGRKQRESEEEEDMRVHMHRSGSLNNSRSAASDRPASPGSITTKYGSRTEAVHGGFEGNQHLRAAKGNRSSGEGGRKDFRGRVSSSQVVLPLPLADAPCSDSSGFLPTDGPASFLALLASDLAVAPNQLHDAPPSGASGLLPASVASTPHQPHSARRGSSSNPQLPIDILPSSPFSAASVHVPPAERRQTISAPVLFSSAAATQPFSAFGANQHLHQQQRLKPHLSAGFRSGAMLPSMLEAARESDSSSIATEGSSRQQAPSPGRRSVKSAAVSAGALAAPAVDAAASAPLSAPVAPTAPAGRQLRAVPLFPSPPPLSAPATALPGRQHPIPSFPPPGHRLVCLDAAGRIVPVEPMPPQLTGWHTAAAPACHPLHGILLAGGHEEGSHPSAAIAAALAPASAPLTPPPPKAWLAAPLRAPTAQALMLAACGLLVVLNLTILFCCAMAVMVVEEVRRVGRG